MLCLCVQVNKRDVTAFKSSECLNMTIKQFNNAVLKLLFCKQHASDIKKVLQIIIIIIINYKVLQ